MGGTPWGIYGWAAVAFELREKEKKMQGKEGEGEEKREKGKGGRRRRENGIVWAPATLSLTARQGYVSVPQGLISWVWAIYNPVPENPLANGHCGSITERALRMGLWKPNPEKGVDSRKKTHCPQQCPTGRSQLGLRSLHESACKSWLEPSAGPEHRNHLLTVQQSEVNVMPHLQPTCQKQGEQVEERRISPVGQVAGSRERAQRGLRRWWRKFVRVAVFIIVGEPGTEDCCP